MEKFRLHELLATSNLVEKLIEHFKVREAFRHLVTLHREIFVSTIGYDLQHACIVLFDDLQGLLSVVNSSNSTVDILFLNGSLILLASDVG